MTQTNYSMNGEIKKAVIGIAITILSAVILWYGVHAIKAETHMAADEVQTEAMQSQLDRIETKVDWLIELQIQGNK